MHDTHGHPRLDRYPRSEASQDGLERFWAQEMERRRSRRRGWLASVTGSASALATPFMFLGTYISFGQDNFSILAAAVAASASGFSSLWLTKQGVTELWNSRPLPPPQTHRTERGKSRRGIGSEKETEWQVLEILQRHEEITPARVALETALTVDEAQRKLSELAEKGHVDVRVEGSKLLYSL